MVDLEKINVSAENYLLVINKLLKKENIYKTIDGEKKLIGSKGKLYLGNNYFLTIDKYIDKKENKERVSFGVGYVSFQDRLAIAKFKKENEVLN